MGDMGSRITPWTAHPSMGNDLYSLHYLNSCTGFRQTHWKVSSCGNWILLMWLQRDVLEFLQLSSPFSGPLSSLYCEPLSLFTQKMSLQSRRLSCGCTENVHFPGLDQVTRSLVSTLFGIHALWNKKLLSYSSSYKSSDYNLHWASIFSPKHQYFPVTPDAGHMLHHG